MTKKVVVVYDDTKKPNWDIRSITGKKGFGDTIFKRISLRQRMRMFFEKQPMVDCFVDATELSKIKANTKAPVIVIKSNYAIKDEKAVEVLINKALYAHENYKVCVNNKNACVIYKSFDSFITSRDEDASSYPEIIADCFTDISDVSNFRQFITSGFEARFFNSLSGDEYTVVKTSDNKEKLWAEYSFYELLPDNMKQWFVRPYNFCDDGDKASYSMQRYNMTDLAIRYVHGAIGLDEFEDILDKLFYFIRNRQVRQISTEEYDNIATKLYITKVSDRIQKLREMEGFEKIEQLIVSSTEYDGIDAIINRYFSLYETVRKGRKFIPVKVVAHGDMCFSNILYSQAASLLVLIDPKGATAEDELYMDPYYDLAKLSHSICGHYDFFNSDLYEISMCDDLKSHLIVDADNRPYVELFKNKLNENDLDFKLIRLYEASLFLSMLPLHMDRPKKVFAFILNAIAIMDSLEE